MTQNPDEPALIAESVAPFEGSCDCCGESQKRIVAIDPDTSAYTCDDCIALEERAIVAAAEVLRIELPRSNAPYQVHLARKVIDAYWTARTDGGDLCSDCHHQRRSHWPEGCNYAECDCTQFDGSACGELS